MRLNHLKPNQSELILDSGIIQFYSYSTCVAAFIPGKGVYKTEVKHSKTTSRHVNSWLTQFSPNVTITIKPQAFFDFISANPELEITLN